MLSLLNALQVGDYILIGIGAVLIILAAVAIGFIPIGVYIRALVSGGHVSAVRLVAMKLRRVEVALIVDCYINARKAGVPLTINDLETHYLAGGNVARVVDALITAHGAKIKLTVGNARAIDLSGRDILQAVKQSVTPVVIMVPEVSAVAKNGIELKVKTRVTVKANLEKLIGGAGQETIIAKVGEGIVTTIGSASSHEDVLENPDRISKTVLDKDLDKDTAFEILSVDIADIDVGRNIGAELQAERARSDMQVATAKAEERRAMAIAAEQEMRAKTQEMRAKLLNAESEVPKAISSAFYSGNIGIMDYYKMQNLVSDTGMRNAIGSGASKDTARKAEEDDDKDGKKGKK